MQHPHRPFRRKVLLSAILLVLASVTIAAIARFQYETPLPLTSANTMQVVPETSERTYVNEQVPAERVVSAVDLDSLIAGLSPREKLAQLVVVWAHGRYHSNDSGYMDELNHLVAVEGIGGLMFSRGNIYDQALLTNKLQSVAPIPLWITQDMEFGAAMRVNAATRITPAMGVAATGNEMHAWQKGRITALEAKALGVHQIFAPVADINNNPDNPVINTRSFSEDPHKVAQYATAFIHGVQSTGLMATVKHFPGHGDTNVDSHYALPVLSLSWERLNEFELSPFRAAIQAGVGSVMSAHIAFPELAEEPRRPGTLSPAMLNGVLRDSLGFEGLIVTDALEMRGISANYRPGEALIMAIQAGADILLAPRNVLHALDEAEKALRNGDLSMEQVDRALNRFLSVKRQYGLFEAPPVDLNAIDAHIATRPNLAAAAAIARESLTLLKNERSVLPLQSDAQRIHIISVTNATQDQAGGELERFMRRYSRQVGSDGLDMRSTREDVVRAVRNARRADVVILALPTSVGGRLRNNHPALENGLFRQLQQLPRPVVAAVFGNPYILEEVAFARAHVLGWAATEGQYEAFAHAAFGASAFTGTLPVSIGSMYERGRGYYLPKTKLRADLPESAGLHSDSLRQIDQIVRQAIEREVFPGASVAVVSDGVLVYNKSYGYHTYDKLVPVENDHVFDLASITKVMATTLASMKLVDEGRLQLDQPVANFFPEFAVDDKAGITIRHLLLHTSGLPAFRVYVDSIQSREPLIQAILNEPLINTPGEVYVYSDLGMITLALIIEQITGTDLNSYLQETIYGPLGLSRTTFNAHQLGEQVLQEVLPTEIDTVFRNAEIRGYVHDERAYYLDGIAGHAGLFSTSEELAVLVQLLIDKGTYGGVRMFSEAVADTFTARQPPLDRRGLGFDAKSLTGFTSAGQRSGSQTYGHLGFTGTSFWIDPETKTGVILLTNRTYPYRGETSGIARVRAAVADAVFGSYIQ